MTQQIERGPYPCDLNLLKKIYSPTIEDQTGDDGGCGRTEGIERDRVVNVFSQKTSFMVYSQYFIALQVVSDLFASIPSCASHRTSKTAQSPALPSARFGKRRSQTVPSRLHGTCRGSWTGIPITKRDRKMTDATRTADLAGPEEYEGNKTAEGRETGAGRTRLVGCHSGELGALPTLGPKDGQLVGSPRDWLTTEARLPPLAE
ncbi:hypothetical protein MKZ38_010002 [Zalerion maritima]|uniref:Uncharacterized protein n=1 Tax=Zalerion maritima TaxID=339359 RepID=A0AAD5WMZ4_9PEZI|nr:hypothetical protein MKZ38_010002 [Zalerion maritima]